MAIGDGEHARAYFFGTWAIKSLKQAGEIQRYLTLTLDLLHKIPQGVGLNEVYDVKSNYFYYLSGTQKTPNLEKITECAKELDEISRELGKSYISDISYRQSVIYRRRGMWQEALSCYEVSWSQDDADEGDPYMTADRIITTLLQLARSAEARIWLKHLKSRFYPHDAKISHALSRLYIAMHDNDVQECRGAILALDDAMGGVESQFGSTVQINAAVAGLVLDEDFGDPMSPSHPGAIRLNEFSNKNPDDPYQAEMLHETIIFWKIACLRYAAGMAPVEDYYYRKSQELQSPDAARLPTQIPARVSGARESCDDALQIAILLDTAYRCTFRQAIIRSMRARVDEIAAVYGL